MKVAELTVEELEAMIRRVVDQALAEHDEDNLELRDDFVIELEKRLESDEPGISLDEMARELGLS